MNVVMVRYLTDAQQRRLLATLKERSHVLARRDHAWIRILIGTGFRIREFETVTLGDAQFALEKGWLFRPAACRKGGQRDHQVPVSATVREALEDLIAIRAALGGGHNPIEPLVFSRKHGRMSVRAYQERLAHWCAIAGIAEDVSPHWLRHTAGMNVMKHSKARDPRGVVQALLGHASISSTGIYTGVTKEELQAAVEQVDGRRRLPAALVAKAYAERRAA